MKQRWECKTHCNSSHFSLYIQRAESSLICGTGQLLISVCHDPDCGADPGDACINFMNLSTARASKRAKEVGVRIIGAGRYSLSNSFG